MGKGTGKSVQPLLAGVRCDVESLLGRFARQPAGQRSFGHFARLFRDAGYSHIYEGRQTVAEVRELCEGVLSMCVAYCVPPRARLADEQAAGVYALYALYNVQPEGHAQRIRVTPEQARALADVERRWTAEHTDALYCYNWLAADNAFLVCQYQDHYSALSSFHYDPSMASLAPPLGDTAGGGGELDALSDLAGDRLLADAHALHNAYAKEKAALVGRIGTGGGGGRLARHLAKRYSDPRELVLRERDEYAESVRRLFYRPADERRAECKSAAKANLVSRRAQLRQGAYGGEVTVPRHRVHKGDRSQEHTGGESAASSSECVVQPVDEEMPPPAAAPAPAPAPVRSAMGKRGRTASGAKRTAVAAGVRKRQSVARRRRPAAPKPDASSEVSARLGERLKIVAPKKKPQRRTAVAAAAAAATGDAEARKPRARGRPRLGDL